MVVHRFLAVGHVVTEAIPCVSWPPMSSTNFSEHRHPRYLIFLSKTFPITCVHLVDISFSSRMPEIDVFVRDSSAVATSPTNAWPPQASPPIRTQRWEQAAVFIEPEDHQSPEHRRCSVRAGHGLRFSDALAWLNAVVCTGHPRPVRSVVYGFRIRSAVI
jgi:hypothetical protein